MYFCLFLDQCNNKKTQSVWGIDVLNSFYFNDTLPFLILVSCFLPTFNNIYM